MYACDRKRNFNNIHIYVYASEFLYTNICSDKNQTQTRVIRIVFARSLHSDENIHITIHTKICLVSVFE